MGFARATIPEGTVQVKWEKKTIQRGKSRTLRIYINDAIREPFRGEPLRTVPFLFAKAFCPICGLVGGDYARHANKHIAP